MRDDQRLRDPGARLTVHLTVQPDADAPPLRPRDAAALARYHGVRSTHTYTASWFHNATFVFPLLAAAIAGIVWLATGSGEAGGAALFFLVVTAVMLPVVFVTWRRTTTAIVVHEDGISALHQGEEQHTLAWEELRGVRRVETMGNVRWYLDGVEGEHIVVEGEISDREQLLDAAGATPQPQQNRRPPADRD